MTMEHTPAPWAVTNNRISGDTGSGAATGICDMLGNCGSIPMLNANARLIAAAPEMLEALREADKVMDFAKRYFPKSTRSRYRLLNVQANIVRAAINKATGTPTNNLVTMEKVAAIIKAAT